MIIIYINYSFFSLLSFTGSLSADSLEKEKLISSYSEKMPLKAETGNSYCNLFFFTFLLIYFNCLLKLKTLFASSFNRRLLRSFNERQSHLCRYFFFNDTISCIFIFTLR